MLGKMELMDERLGDIFSHIANFTFVSVISCSAREPTTLTFVWLVMSLSNLISY